MNNKEKKRFYGIAVVILFLIGADLFLMSLNHGDCRIVKKGKM